MNEPTLDPRVLLAVLVGISVVAATVVAIIVITNNAEGVDEAAATLEQIQAERARNVRATCEDINERHDNTLKQLDVLLAEARVTATPEEIREIEENRAGTVLLLEAIVPRRDCDALVRKSVGSR